MPSRENNWLRGLDKWLDKQGPEVWYVNIHGGIWQKAGLPDRLILWAGVLVAVEAKQEGKKPTDLQNYILSRIANAGGVVIRGATDKDQIITRLEDLDNYRGKLRIYN